MSQDILLEGAPVIRYNVLILLLFDLERDRDYPCLQLPVNDSDNQYAALQWEETATSLALKRFTQSKDWVKNQIDVRITMSTYM